MKELIKTKEQINRTKNKDKTEFKKEENIKIKRTFGCLKSKIDDQSEERKKERTKWQTEKIKRTNERMNEERMNESNNSEWTEAQVKVTENKTKNIFNLKRLQNAAIEAQEV